MQDLRGLKPSCFSLSLESIAFLIVVLLGMDNSCIPLQFWQSLRSSFLGSMTKYPVFQSPSSRHLLLVPYWLEKIEQNIRCRSRWCLQCFWWDVVWIWGVTILRGFFMTCAISCVLMGPKTTSNTGPASSYGWSRIGVPLSSVWKLFLDQSICSIAIIEEYYQSNDLKTRTMNILKDPFTTVSCKVLTYNPINCGKLFL